MAQAANKNIDNASGQVVRLDIENTLKTVATHNFGPRNNAGTILPCEFLADDTTNKLLIRKSSGGDQANPSPSSGTAATFFEVGDLDTANLGLLPKSGGTMTGVLQLPNGSQSTPSLRFGDAGTGLFRDFSNSVSFTSSGSKVFHVDSNGINIHSSKELKWRDNDSSNFISFRAPNTISSNLSLTLPTADGTSGQALITNGSGTLSFGAPTVGAANLTGNTLASGVTASSLTSVGTLSSLAVSGTCTAGTFSGSGASLTNIPAEQLTGTVADARISSLTSSKLSGALPAIDGSALTGITSLVKQIKEVTATSQQEVQANNAFNDALTLTLNNTSSTSRVLVLSTFRIHSSTPYQSNRFARAKTTIGEDGTFAGDRQDEALNGSGSSSSDAHHSTILLDENSTSGNREYRIRFKKDTSGRAFIANCRLIAIEFEVS